MSLSEPVAVVIGSLITGVAAGGPAVWLGRRSKRTPVAADPARVEQALQARADKLDELLRAQYEQRIANAEGRVTVLEATVEDRDRTIADLQPKPRRRSPNDG